MEDFVMMDKSRTRKPKTRTVGRASQKRRPRQKGKKRYNGELPVSATTYPVSRWPYDLARYRSNADLHTIVLFYDSTILVDGSKNITDVFSNNPNTAPDWTSFADVFEEYRVLDLVVTFSPLKGFGGSSPLYWAPIATVVDRTDATALTGYSAAAEYGSFKEYPGLTRFVVHCPMSGIQEADFGKTSAPSATAWIKLWSTANTAGNLAGHVQVALLVQFRGIGLT